MTVISDDIDEFKKDCIEYGCKPLLIELQNDTSSYQQLMTSQKFTHKNWNLETNRATDFFSKKYKIQRVKIEVNPYAYNDLESKYYETHFRLVVNSDNKDKIDDIITRHKFHKSKNIFKKINESDVYQMATYREHGISLQKFESIVSNFRKDLENENISFDKIEIESCIVDTNDDLDKKWLR